jgi:hypothetical protein
MTLIWLILADQKNTILTYVEISEKGYLNYRSDHPAGMLSAGNTLQPASAGFAWQTRISIRASLWNQLSSGRGQFSGHSR